MDNTNHPVYSHNVVEFVAVANEFCKYAEHAGEIKGDEMLRIMQRIMPLMYLKASLLPSLEPVFDDGNEKFVTETDWQKIHDTLARSLGTANDFMAQMGEVTDDSDIPVPITLSENMADIYQDMKDFVLLYQTGTTEVMNDAVWECRMNFETFWGQKLLNSLRTIHGFIYSGKQVEENDFTPGTRKDRNTDEWFLSKRQKDFRGE
ncbi:MAG TPA: DUF5063 domain-containing protein [Bacteroidales bacterium]|nr:DUF5063 domain-containing protein [Bacteroidales bacterium]